ncbi:single-stranded DNA-binding protein 3 isoform X6 [Schistocerca americana]|uniref:single-stranded DNA-binding protein 3 isoform X6 n=1 Tax=Schistocerca americana TaxID=7009 RepID=UPI001F4F2D4E|nr:single-stranded DNA-binding protein 3 isoform X6 [Schistocerca americana]XP_047101953.1 single-stranded DNA-binding protein 3 isoform X6 [Schistocerca piceifrons]XP_049805398.1 single-stranded DNA-binding protein 3 isoform X5 [Schistocerca nitens]XP_049844172.1 single-stranded DNA-binding protein 3 isoform X10 [Schistocerca gregaria]XP_049954137.1 single-stranded DNA-binding protein 3 isoform X6 [Schistocerca serialis cubense]
MYAKGKGSTVPSDAQAREKLALYVYEYLLHVGAQKAAQTFLSEIRWEKNITLGEPPGFLHSWWCVFWDLYCAAPERRDTCEHSSEAKAFHDYGFVNSGYGVNGIAHNAGPAPSPLGQMPPNDGMPGGPMPPGFFPPFMGPRYPAGPRPGVRMPQLGNEFNGPPGQPMLPNSMDPSRQGEGGEFVGWQGPPGMSPMNPRMNPPRGPAMGPMGPGSYGPGMRGPPPTGTLGPGGPGGPGPGGPAGPGMPPMSMAGPGGRPQWQPNTSTPMNYSSSSPGNYGGPPGSAGPPGPGTPIMPSPQGSVGPYSPASHRMPTPSPVTRQDSSNSGGENMYTMMKSVPGGNIPGDFPMATGPEGGPMGPMGPNTMGPVMNGDGLDGMKNSPANGGPGTPREDSGSGMGDYNLGGFGGPGENDQTESAAILKIKESMQEEAKRFEKDSDHPDYFMQ